MIAQKLKCLLVLSILLGKTQARLFTLQKPGTSMACIMVNIDFKIEIHAMKNHHLVATKTLTTNDEGITTSGICVNPTMELIIKFKESTFWYIAFRPPQHEPKPVAQYRGLQFLPAELFGKTVNVSTQEIFYDAQPVYQTNINDSFFCPNKYQTLYLSTNPVSGDFSFKVNVTVFSIQSQGFNIMNNEFGPQEHCAILSKPLPLPKKKVL